MDYAILDFFVFNGQLQLKKWIDIYYSNEFLKYWVVITAKRNTTYSSAVLIKWE